MAGEPAGTVAVPIDEVLHARLGEVAIATGKDVVTVVAAAVEAHLQVVQGGANDPAGREFTKVASDRQAQVVLRQDSEVQFFQVEPFRYQDDKGRHWDVKGGPTDLASVPAMMTWLVPRYGRHTLPALLHDHLQEEKLGVPSWDADDVFRDSMRSSGVPFVRRWAMWAAVAVRTLLKKEDPSKRWRWWILLVVWLGGYGVVSGLYLWPRTLTEVWEHSRWPGLLVFGVIVLAGIAVVLQDKSTYTRPDAKGYTFWKAAGTFGGAVFPFLAGGVMGGAVVVAATLAVSGDSWVPLIQVGVILSPLLTSLCWGRRAYRAAAIAGVAFSLLAVPAAFVLWALLIYRGLEGFAGLFRKDGNPVTVREWQDRMGPEGPAGAAEPPAGS